MESVSNACFGVYTRGRRLIIDFLGLYAIFQSDYKEREIIIKVLS